MQVSWAKGVNYATVFDSPFLIVFRCHPVIVGFTRARLLALWPLLLWELTLCYWLHIASLPCVHAYFNWKRRQTSRLLNLVRDDFPFRDGRFSGAFAFELSGNIIKQSTAKLRVRLMPCFGGLYLILGRPNGAKRRKRRRSSIWQEMCVNLDKPLGITRPLLSFSCWNPMKDTPNKIIEGFSNLSGSLAKPGKAA